MSVMWKSRKSSVEQTRMSISTSESASTIPQIFHTLKMLLIRDMLCFRDRIILAAESLSSQRITALFPWERLKLR